MRIHPRRELIDQCVACRQIIVIGRRRQMPDQSGRGVLRFQGRRRGQFSRVADIVRFLHNGKTPPWLWGWRFRERIKVSGKDQSCGQD